MKRNFLRLFLMMGLLSLNSCRQDILPEHETYNNSGAFQLTSQRISLDEAKHKAKLLPELEQVENKFKTKTKNAQGKLVNFGNGVSIDTDDVIYIQNGPNYYTYTFRINRDNAPADALVENLVLSPLSDGSWKEVLITYDLTAQEKQTMLSGGAVNLAGKVTKEILQSGTYSSGIMNKGSWDNCYMVTSSHYTMCSDGKHNHGEPAGNYEDGNCEAVQLSVLVVTVDIICSNPGGGYTGSSGNESGTTPGGFNPSGGGSGNPTDPSGSNGGNNPNNPCGGNGVPSQPQNPGSGLGNEECNNGTVTLPNLGGSLTNNTPCERVNAITSNQKFKDNIVALTGKLNLGSETGYRMDYQNQTSAAPIGTGITNQFLQSKPGTTQIEFTYFVPPTYAIIHTHYNSLNDPMFSPGDLIQFNDWLVAAKAWNDNPANLLKVDLKKLSYTVVTDFGNYMLTFDGTNVAPFSGYDIDALNDDYSDRVSKAATVNFSGEVNFNMNKLEEEFLKFSKKHLSMPGMKLFRLASDGNKEIFLDNNNKRDTNTCN